MREEFECKMSRLWADVKNITWNERIWIPENYTWSDLENKDGGIYRCGASDIYIGLLIGVFLFVLRLVFERYVAQEIGSRLIHEKPSRTAPPNRALETFYKTNRTPNTSEVKGLVKQTDLSERQVQRWFRIRRNQDKCSVLKKFREGSWRFTVYLVLVFWGFYVLWDKPWFTRSDEFWTDWPDQHVPNDIYWYYVTELGLYFSLFASQFTDVKRKDFWELLIHHIAAISLIGLTLISNIVRMGTLVTIVHDICDPILELTKLITYVDPTNKLCDGLFVVFLVAWIITRLIIYPYRCMWNAMMCRLGTVYIYYVYCVFLILLYVLHLIWTLFIIQIAVRRITGTEPLQDSRSSDEDSVSDENENVDKIRNGSVVANGH